MYDHMPVLIQYFRPKYHGPESVPMDMLDEVQALKNHQQTLQRLAERGGLSPCEMLAVMDKRDWCRLDREACEAELARRVNAHEKAPVRPVTTPDDAG